MKKYVLMAGLIALMCSCSESNVPAASPPDGKVFTKNFIQTYVIPSDIALVSPANGCIAIVFDGDTVENTDEKSEYDNLAEKYQDLSYNDYLARYSTQAIGKEFSAIDIVCDNDFDESHSAGMPLNDIVKIRANSFQKFIKSGYDDSFESPELPGESSNFGFYNGKGHYPIYKSLNDVTEEDLVLIEPTVYLLFESGPAVAGWYGFTINVNSSNDILSKKINLYFE